jgi:hypothetical protein
MGRVLVAFISSIVLGTLVACGTTETEERTEVLGSVSSALATCSTTCFDGSSVTCQGTRCSANDGVFVECDGIFWSCPPRCQSFIGTSEESYEQACENALQVAQQDGAAYCAPFGGIKSVSRLCVRDANTPPFHGSYRVCCNR